MQQIHEVENELLNKGYKDLGWMNAWENDPPDTHNAVRPTMSAGILS